MLKGTVARDFVEVFFFFIEQTLLVLLCTYFLKSFGIKKYFREGIKVLKRSKIMKFGKF